MKKACAKRLMTLCAILALGMAVCQSKPLKVSSPDGKLNVEVGLENNQPFYNVDYQGERIISKSHLGYMMKMVRWAPTAR